MGGDLVMATYDLTSTTPEKIKTGDILNCPYSGSRKSIKLPAGIYVLEVWGAQGGDNYSSTNYGSGGKGGYSAGTLKLTDEETTLYLYSGGAGTSSTSTSQYDGGFNGGGKSTNYAGSGGGASDIRIGIDSLYHRVIVAGGGGGAQGRASTSYKASGGAGGGINGQTGGYYGTNVQESANGGAYGTQTAAGGAGSTTYGNTAGAFGVGGDGQKQSSTYCGCGGGGGGWYGGGTGYYRYSGGGGGSGFVWTGSNAPSGYGLTSAYYLTNAATTLGTSSFLSPTAAFETGHSGNGYVRITVLQSPTIYKKENGVWTEVTYDLRGLTYDFSGALSLQVTTLINLTIDDTTFTAESGSTWREWVETENNEWGIYVIDGYINDGAGMKLTTSDGEYALPDDEIIANHAYEFIW
jgi:hypothetical protein